MSGANSDLAPQAHDCLLTMTPSDDKMTTTRAALIGRALVLDFARLAHGHRDDDDDDQQMPLI